MKTPQLYEWMHVGTFAIDPYYDHVKKNGTNTVEIDSLPERFKNAWWVRVRSAENGVYSVVRCDSLVQPMTIHQMQTPPKEDRRGSQRSA